MIRALVKYPDSSIRRISGNVRFFDASLDALIVDMTDTMNAHGLEALSAILIGIDLNVIILKEQVYINSRIIKHSELETKTERSIYYEGISADVDRYEKITIIYEDASAKSHSRDFEGEEARSFQQHLDHCFGSTFVDRVEKEVKQRIDEHLEFGLVKDSGGSGSCPIVFYREYFKKAAKYTMLAIVLTFAIVYFWKNTQEQIYRVDKYALCLIPLLLIAYFFYAQYESKKYKQCTSCQMGNIIGSVLIMTFQFVLIAIGVLFWVKP
jgi:peptide deformylase